MTENSVFDENRIGDVLERNYRKPPVVEALCEVYFEKAPWDETLPEKFFEEVKDDFPTRQEKTTHRAEITLESSETASADIKTLTSVFQFFSENGDQVIQIAENLLVVNQLSPYRPFEEWESLFYRSLDIYKKLASSHKVVDIGIRYINHFEIPIVENVIPMENYFTILPTIPESLGKIHGLFSVRVQIPEIDDNKRSMRIIFGTEGAPDFEEKKQAFLLDLYDRISLVANSDRDELAAEIRRSHEKIVRAFEDSITDTLRQLLEIEEKE